MERFLRSRHMITVLFCILFCSFGPLLFIGSLDIDVLKGTFEKLSNISFAIVIGYSALLAAIVPLSEEDNRARCRNEIRDFIQFTIVYVVLNLFIYLFSSIMPSDGSQTIVCILILLVVLMLFLISYRLFNLVLHLFN